MRSRIGLRRRRLTDNRLLALLPSAEREALARELDWVAIPPRTALYGPSKPLTHAYFPTDGLVSILYHLAAREACAELGLVGVDGMLGSSLVMGGDAAPNRAVTRTWCYAYRMGAAALAARFSRGGSLQGVLLRYTQALITQYSVNAVCHLHHSTEQQLCRWLLGMLECSVGETVRTTTETIAEAFGVRRQAVMAAAQRLAQAGAIRQGRGWILVLDRRLLLERACECHEVARREAEKLLPRPLPPARWTPAPLLRPVADPQHAARAERRAAA